MTMPTSPPPPLESADSATVGKKVEGMTLRKSARLGRNVPPINTTRPKKEPQEVEAVKKEDIKSEQKIGITYFYVTKSV